MITGVSSHNGQSAHLNSAILGDAVAVPLDADAETVLLDFVEPLWPGRDLGRIGRQAELERLEHALR